MIICAIGKVTTGIMKKVCRIAPGETDSYFYFYFSGAADETVLNYKMTKSFGGNAFKRVNDVIIGVALRWPKSIGPLSCM